MFSSALRTPFKYIELFDRRSMGRRRKTSTLFFVRSKPFDRILLVGHVSRRLWAASKVRVGFEIGLRRARARFRTRRDYSSKTERVLADESSKT